MKREPFSEWQINFTTTSGIEDFFTEDEDEYNEKFQDLIDNEDLKYVEQCVRKDYVWDEELEDWVEDWVDVLYDTENYDDYVNNKSDNAQYESKYEVDSYYDYDLKGLEDFIYTNDWNEVETFAHEKLMQGNMIKIINKETGKEEVINPDKYIEEFNGEFTVRPEQLDESKEQKVTYNIYVLEGGDGVYNSVKVDTVDSEEQAEDRVAELQAETGSNAYYKKVVNGKVVEDISEDGKLVDKITNFLEENDIYGEVDVDGNNVSVLIEWGDWKHEHLKCDYLMKQLGYERVGEEVTEEDGSDCFSAIRYYRKNDNSKKIEKLDKNDNVKVKWFEHRDYGDFRADIIQGQLEDGRYFTSGDIDSIQVYKKGYNAIQRLNDKAVIDDEDEIEKIENEMANNEDNISQEDLDYINNYIYNISQEDNLMESKKANNGLVVCDKCLRAIRSREEISDEDIEEEIPDRYIEVVDNDTGTELGYCMWCGDEFEVTDLYYIKPDKKTEDLTKYEDSNPDKVESDAEEFVKKVDRMKSLGIWNGKDDTFKDAENKLKDIDNVNKEMKIEAKKVQEMELNLPVKEAVTLTEKEVVDKEVQDFVQQCEESGKFNDDQMEVIKYGLKYNLTLEQIKLYAKPELSYGMMFEIEAGFSSGLTMEQVKFYAKPELYDDNQMRIIRYGFENGLTIEQIEFYAKPELDYHIMAEIEDGFSQGLTMEQVKFYAKPELYNDKQMEQIRWGFVDGLTLEQIKLYAKPEFNADQMGQIKGGFDDGLTLEQVEQYAKPELTEFDMVQIRYKLKNGLMTEALRESRNIKKNLIEDVNIEKEKEKVEQEIQEKGIKETIDTENELVEGIKKEIYQFAKQQGLDLEKLRKQGVELDTISDTIDKVIGDMVSKSAIEFMDQTGQEIDWDFDIRDNDIHIVWNNRK